jgi:hypothetical protein
MRACLCTDARPDWAHLLQCVRELTEERRLEKGAETDIIASEPKVNIEVCVVALALTLTVAGWGKVEAALRDCAQQVRVR